MTQLENNFYHKTLDGKQQEFQIGNDTQRTNGGHSVFSLNIGLVLLLRWGLFCGHVETLSLFRVPAERLDKSGKLLL